MDEHSVVMGQGGRVVIPAALRKAMSIKSGDALILKLENGELRLFQQKAALAKLRAALAKHLQGKTFTVDDFLRERRTDWGE